MYYYQRVKKILHNERVHNMKKNITVKIISAAMAAAMAVSAVGLVYIVYGVIEFRKLGRNGYTSFYLCKI